MKKRILFIPISISILCAIGFIVYFNTKIQEMTTKLDTDVGEFAQTIVKEVNTKFMGAATLSTDTTIKCTKEGWLMPQIICSLGRWDLSFHSEQAPWKIYSVRDFKLIVEPSLKTLFDKAIRLKLLGGLEASTANILKILDAEGAKDKEKVFVKTLISILPKQFSLTYDIAQEKDAYILTTHSQIQSALIDIAQSTKMRYKAPYAQKPSLYALSDIFYEQDLATLMSYELKLTKTAETTQKVRSIVFQLSNFSYFPKISLEDLSPALNIYTSMWEFPHSQEFAKFLQESLAVFIDKKQSSTLIITAKKDATELPTISTISNVFFDTANALPMDTLIDALERYDVQSK